MIIDTHCHYNISPLWSDEQPTAWQQHWDSARDHGVVGSIVVGVNAQTNEQAIEIAKTDHRLIAAVGFHPTDDLPDTQPITPEYTAATLQTIEQTIRALCSTNPVAAIGEVGLDYFRLSSDPEQANACITHQKAVCALQLSLAAEFELPLILHVRDGANRTAAYDDILELLKTKASFAKPFILHCVSGPLPYIAEAIALGAYIGVAGNVTYPSAQAIRDIVQSVPKNRVLLETDAPFLAPQSHRGKPCEPWMIADTAEYVSTQLALSPEQIIENSLQVFPQFAAATSQPQPRTLE